MGSQYLEMEIFIIEQIVSLAMSETTLYYSRATKENEEDTSDDTTQVIYIE